MGIERVGVHTIPSGNTTPGCGHSPIGTAFAGRESTRPGPISHFLSAVPVLRR